MNAMLRRLPFYFSRIRGINGRRMSSANQGSGDGDENPMTDRLSDFFKRAEEKIAHQQETEQQAKVESQMTSEAQEETIVEEPEKKVIGVVIENVNNTDLYIDFGGKFHCVCPTPVGQNYPRGSLVRIRLHDPEMTNQFMINSMGITLCEADATLMGPYRGRVVRNANAEEAMVPVVPGDDQGATRPATEADSVWVENWRLL